MTQNGPPTSASTRASDQSVAGEPIDAAETLSGARSPTDPKVDCPGCARHIRLPQAQLKPGRFKLVCSGCHRAFGLLVDEQRHLRVVPLQRRSASREDLSPDIAAALGMDAERTSRPARPPAPTGAGVTLPPAAPAGDLPLPTAPTRPPRSIDAPTLDPASGEHTIDAYSTAAAGGDGFIAPPSRFSPSLPPPTLAAGDRIGGYELKKKLGEGGMGAVYLAQQLSLERDVALKVLSPRLSGNPALVGRFMREAYAAGQLTHHNVVPIYDFGHQGADPANQASDIHYFSMEFVDGQSLQGLVDHHGRVEPQKAVTLILQAARGLLFAHDHGIIHRDIKPDNLMLNKLGVVKVADLGLVKQLGLPEESPEAEAADGEDSPAPAGKAGLSTAASAHLTQAAAMMGTPAYMAPEQASDAKAVDARADIYSLGCTLYHLLVGRPPFGGATLQEVLDAHRCEKLQFAEAALGGPKLSNTLKDIVRRMCGKFPGDRYASMKEVGAALEAYLAAKHKLNVEPDEQQHQTLRFAARQFNQSTWANARPFLITGFVVALLGGIVAVVSTVSNPITAFGLVGGVIGVGVLGFAFGFILTGLRTRDVLFVKTRQFAAGAGMLDWMLAVIAAGVLLWVLWNFGWLWWWLGAAVLAFGLALLWQSVVVAGMRGDQRPMVLRAERVLKEMREVGVDEPRIRRSVAEAAGNHWEAFYEALFGYEVKLDARRSFGTDEKGVEKPRFAAWRDPILSWLEARLEKRRIKRDQAFLQSVVKNEMLAQGIRSEVADKQALNQANREIGKAHVLHQQMLAELRGELRKHAFLESLRETAREQEAVQDKQRETEATELEDGKRKIKRKEIRYTDDDFERIHESYFKRRFGTPLDLILGQQVRFAVAAVLLVCFALWFNQNQREIFVGEEAPQAQAVDAAWVGLDDATAPEPPRLAFLWGTGETRALQVPGIDENATRWLSGFQIGLAGAILALSAFFFGRVLGVLSLLSTLIIVAGTPLMAERDVTMSWLPSAIGIVLTLLGMFFFRVSEE